MFVAVTVATITVGVFTSLVFLDRAGSSPINNWPTNWDISVSDNSVLYQFSQDVFDFRHLNWGFSPQVYIFPEIPISLTAYLLSFANIYRYFIIVAVINNCLLFLVIYGLIGIIYRRSRFNDKLGGAFLASTPLFLLPLLGSNPLFSYHLAPTYYFGSYLLILSTPLIFFLKRKRNRWLFAIFYCLTAASNPLLLVFSVPGLLLVLTTIYLKKGLKDITRPSIKIAFLVLISLLIRKLFFTSLIGTSAGNYISFSLFYKRLVKLKLFYNYGFNNKLDHLILAACVIGLIFCCFYAIRVIRQYIITKDTSFSSLSLIFINFTPLTTLICLYCLMVINNLYLWPIIVLPLIIILIDLPRRLVRATLILSLVILVCILLAPSSIHRILNSTGYFHYKTPIASCIDSKLPAKQTIGYATLSDARETELSSSRNLLIIQLLPLLNANTWLTNRDYIKDYTGSFFIINNQGNEPPINPNAVTDNFGVPDKIIKCDKNVNILLYTNRTSLVKIHSFYTDLTSKGL